jgi:hypothetical protein
VVDIFDDTIEDSVHRRLTPRALRGRHRLSVCSMLEPGLSFENL